MALWTPCYALPFTSEPNTIDRILQQGVSHTRELSAAFGRAKKPHETQRLTTQLLATFAADHLAAMSLPLAEMVVLVPGMDRLPSELRVVSWRLVAMVIWEISKGKPSTIFVKLLGEVVAALMSRWSGRNHHMSVSTQQAAAVAITLWSLVRARWGFTGGRRNQELARCGTKSFEPQFRQVLSRRGPIHSTTAAETIMSMVVLQLRCIFISASGAEHVGTTCLYQLANWEPRTSHGTPASMSNGPPTYIGRASLRRVARKDVDGGFARVCEHVGSPRGLRGLRAGKR